MEVDHQVSISPHAAPQLLRMAPVAPGRTMLRMTEARITEIPPKLEPTTEDSFVYVAVTDRPRETTAHRIAELFGTERRRAIVD